MIIKNFVISLALTIFSLVIVNLGGSVDMEVTGIEYTERHLELLSKDMLTPEETIELQVIGEKVIEEAIKNKPSVNDILFNIRATKWQWVWLPWMFLLFYCKPKKIQDVLFLMFGPLLALFFSGLLIKEVIPIFIAVTLLSQVKNKNNNK